MSLIWSQTIGFVKAMCTVMAYEERFFILWCTLSFFSLNSSLKVVYFWPGEHSKAFGMQYSSTFPRAIVQSALFWSEFPFVLCRESFEWDESSGERSVLQQWKWEESDSHDLELLSSQLHWIPVTFTEIHTVSTSIRFMTSLRCIYLPRIGLDY